MFNEYSHSIDSLKHLIMYISNNKVIQLCVLCLMAVSNITGYLLYHDFERQTRVSISRKYYICYNMIVICFVINLELFNDSVICKKFLSAVAKFNYYSYICTGHSHYFSRYLFVKI